MAIADPLLLSMISSTIALLLFLPISIPVAWLLARKTFPGKAVLEIVVNAPLVMPPLVTGYLLLLLLSPSSPVGGFFKQTAGLEIPFSIYGAGLAAGIVAFPLMVRILQQRFESLDHRLELAARTLGASPTDTFFSVTLPQAAPGVLAGALIGFARAFGEFGATIILAGNMPGRTQTVPLAIYSALSVPGGEDKAMLFAAISLLVSIAAIAATHLLTRRRERRD